MKLHFRLWIVFSLISFTGLAIFYVLIVNIYSERAMDNQKQVAFSQGYAISERVSGLIPFYLDRAEGYLDFYSDRFDARLMLLSPDLDVTYDSFRSLPPNQRLSLEILEYTDSLPTSIFIRTKSFGLVQYTLLPIDQRHSTSYLLMVTDVNSLDEDVSKFRNQVLIYFAPATLGSLIIFYFIASWFTRPLRKVIWHLKRVTPRRRTFPMRVKGKNEMSQLVEEIRSMIHQLNVYEQRQRHFISTSSHELKTPLATMQLILENLPSMREDEAMHHEYVSDLQLQIDKMRKMVQGMLDVYRLTDKPLHFKQISFDQIRDHVTAHFQYMAESKKIQLKFDHDADSLYADEDLFFRGLDNLVSNALRYSPNAHSTIRIALNRGNSGQVICSVCDQGIGISKEDLPNIFEPFYRSNEVTDLNQEGSGLGLAIVKQMIDLHDGEVKVESKLGEGTCISLHFKRNKSVT